MGGAGEGGAGEGGANSMVVVVKFAQLSLRRCRRREPVKERCKTVALRVS